MKVDVVTLMDDIYYYRYVKEDICSSCRHGSKSLLFSSVYYCHRFNCGFRESNDLIMEVNRSKIGHYCRYYERMQEMYKMGVIL